MFSILILHQSLHHLYIARFDERALQLLRKSMGTSLYKNLQPPITSQNGYAVVAEAAGRHVFMSTTRLESPLLSLQVRLDRV
jgi:hypothetical protein